MKLLFCLFFILYVDFIDSSLYTNLKDTVLTFLKPSDDQRSSERSNNDLARQRANEYDAISAKEKNQFIKRLRSHEEKLNYGKDIPIPKSARNIMEKDGFRKDPVLNSLRRARNRWSESDTDSDYVSSSIEMKDWKEQWGDYWLQKKFEALNTTEKRGDTVNMVAARPWGAACGDPNQHDMPWGTCVLAMECDTEFRIYRGDHFCGRTNFVCCALQNTAYDLYQGIDVSFTDSGLETDTKERERDSGSSENKRKRRARKRRRRERLRRKRQIKRLIRKITREIRKLLSKTYRNGTLARKKRTKQLKRVIKRLKKKYKQDRKTVRDVHDTNMIQINEALKEKLKQVRDLNNNFLKNATFRDILLTGKMTKNTARMLVETYPELRSYVPLSRRSGKEAVEETEAPMDYLEYDIEYGLVYQ